MKGKSRKYVRDVDHMVQNTEKNFCKLQFLWENEFKNVWISSLTLILMI